MNFFANFLQLVHGTKLTQMRLGTHNESGIKSQLQRLHNIFHLKQQQYCTITTMRKSSILIQEQSTGTITSHSNILVQTQL